MESIGFQQGLKKPCYGRGWIEKYKEAPGCGRSPFCGCIWALCCFVVEEAFELLAEHDISLLLSEIHVDGESIAGALNSLKRQYPEIVTLVVTSFKDTHLLIDLINQGQVYRFLPKPISVGLLSKSISAAITHQRALEESPVLTERHSVEASNDAGDRAIAERVRGFLDRLRRRRPGSPAYERAG